jgi:eukaryotic-like serine/threonine-protein kinase
LLWDTGANDPAVNPQRPRPDTPTSGVLTGRRIGVYEVQAPLGAGGMGVVYRALDTNLNRPVAIKFLSLELADADARRRFQREAQMASSLNHPHILTVHDAGEFEGRQYLVTELVDGGTLKDWEKGASRGWRPIIELLTGVADGLAVAHEAGILHRDIKPANILVSKSGYAKLADFGLAKPQDASTENDVAKTVTQTPTQAGVILGTVTYMSPEQALGQPLDVRSDIFSFGVVLYEMLAGRRPFGGTSGLDVLHAVVHQPADPLPEDVPLPLRMVVEKALEKDPEDRFRSMRDMLVDLRRVVRQGAEAGTGSTAKASARRSRHWRPVAALVFALAAVGALWLFRLRPLLAPVRAEYTQITNFADSVVSPALSPDGRMLSFIRSDETFWGFGEVFVKLLPDGEPVQLTRDGHRKVGPAVFSPDGAHIAYTVVENGRQWDTFAAPVLGGQPRRMLANATALTWIGAGTGPAGVLFAEWTNQPPRMELFTSTEGRANQRRIYLPEDINGMVHRAYLSPDRASVLLIEMDASGWLPCRVVPLDGTSRGMQVGPTPGQCTDAAWSSDGKWIFLSANVGKGFHIWRQRFPGGAPEQITAGATEEEGVALAPDGRSMMTSVGTTQSTLWVNDSRGERQITSQGYPASPSFSADGKKLYYLSSPTSQPFINGSGELWAANLETAQLERLLPDVPMEHYSVSRDDNRVVFIRPETAGQSAVWLSTLDGRSAPRRLTSLDSVNAFFGADGDVFFVGGQDSTTFLYRMKEDGSGLRKVTPDPVKLLYDVSPDGQWVAVWAGRSAVVYPAGGGVPTIVCPACANRGPRDQPALVTWSRDGRFVYLHETGLRQTYALPVRDSQIAAALPASGIPSPAAAAALPGALMIPQQRAFGGPDPSVYAFAKVTTHRNIYRIAVP